MTHLKMRKLEIRGWKIPAQKSPQAILGPLCRGPAVPTSSLSLGTLCLPPTSHCLAVTVPGAEMKPWAAQMLPSRASEFTQSAKGI